MTKRLFWLVMGVTIGVLVVRKLSSMAARMTPRGMAESFTYGLSDLADAIRSFGADVREAMAEREAELREGVGFDGQLGKVGEEAE